MPQSPSVGHSLILRKGHSSARYRLSFPPLSLLFCSPSVERRDTATRLDGVDMSLTSYLHDVYSLDTLDKRFTATSSRPHDAGRKLANVRARRASWEDARSRSSESSTGASPSRWRTPEFFLYYLVFLICVPLMFKAGIDASLRTGSFLSPVSTADSAQHLIPITRTTSTSFRMVGYLVASSTTQTSSTRASAATYPTSSYSLSSTRHSASYTIDTFQ